MAQTILVRFRATSKIAVADKSDATVRTDWMDLALSIYNEIMATTLTISTDTTADTLADEAINWLTCAIGYEELYPEKMDYTTKRMMRSVFFEQKAFAVMYTIDETKIEYIEDDGIYIVRRPSSSHTPYMRSIGYDNTGSGTIIGDG